MYVAQTYLTHDNTNAAVVERFTVDPVYDRRGIWRTTMRRLYLRGQIIPNSAPTQAEMLTGLDEIREAYGGNNFDIALYHDDGTRSHFYLTSADSLGGTKVRVRDYPDLTNPADYCTGVGYRIIIEAEYPANQLSPMAWNETIETIGTGGPTYRYQTPRTGLPRREIETQRSIQIIRQSGFALGLTGEPLHDDPLLPNWEEQKLREITRIGPTAAGENLRFINWGKRWSYTFFCPEPQLIFPNVR